MEQSTRSTETNKDKEKEKDEEKDEEKEDKVNKIEELRDLLKEDPLGMDEELRRDYEVVKLLHENKEKTGNANMVLCQVFLNSVQEVNSATQSAKIDFGVTLWFMDSEAVGHSGDTEDWGSKIKIWKPIIEVMGNIDMEEVLADGGSYYIREEYSKYVIVNWYQRFKGNIVIDQDLHEFPFDRQEIKIKFGATLWSSDVISFKDWTRPDQIELFSVGMNFTEWNLVSVPKVADFHELSVEDRRSISYVEISFNLRRRYMYYLTHVVFLVFLINMMTWTVFTIGPDVSSRISLDITLFLALVALNFVVIGFIPKVSYGTKLSQYFVLSYASITLATLHNVVIYFVNDYYCINGYDLAYPLPQTNSTNPLLNPPPRCWTALYLDWTILAVIIIVQVSYTIYYIITGIKSLPGEKIIQHKKNPAKVLLDDESHAKTE